MSSFRAIAIDALDKLSRYRALTEAESISLERAIRIQRQEDARQPEPPQQQGWGNWPTVGT